MKNIRISKKGIFIVSLHRACNAQDCRRQHLWAIALKETMKKLGKF